MNGDETFGPGEERDLLAAEYALGLIEGEALVEARRLAATDADFATAVAAWEERLMPLAGEAPAVIPSPAVWDRVRQAIADAPAAGSNVVDLRRRLNIWRGAAAAAMAVAASLALVVGLPDSKDRTREVAVGQPERAPVLVAALVAPEQETALSVAFVASDRSLLVTPTRLVGAAGRDHQLWIIPAGGSPVSLGLVQAGKPQRLRVPAEAAPHFRPEAALALSVEPAGGSPTGQPTGPVVASGALLVV